MEFFEMSAVLVEVMKEQFFPLKSVQHVFPSVHRGPSVGKQCTILAILLDILYALPASDK